MTEARLVLVHGLFLGELATDPGGVTTARARRSAAIATHGDEIGVRDYEWLDCGRKRTANQLLRVARGTARAPDAVEIIELDEAMVRCALDDPSAQGALRDLAKCPVSGFDPARSFMVAGAPRELLQGSLDGQRVLWFGVGSGHLSDAEFVEHYIGHHGPLVAGHARHMGLRRYRQVPDEDGMLCDALRALGPGDAATPAVFAELVFGRPPVDPASLGSRCSALWQIRRDEKRHVDFQRSMLVLA